MLNRREKIIIAISACVLSSLVEIASLYAMFSTMGHAGPEGGFASIGWLATAMNLPGIFFVGILQLNSDLSTTKLAAIIYAVQMPFLWGLSFIVIRSFASKLKRARATRTGSYVSEFSTEDFENK